MLRTALLIALLALLPAAPARADTADDTLQLINDGRAERDVPPVRADARLALAARDHSREMVRPRLPHRRGPARALSDVEFRTRSHSALSDDPQSALAVATSGDTSTWGRPAFERDL